MHTHGIPLSSQVPLPHGMTWLKVFFQGIFMEKKKLPFLLFTTPSKSPPKNSFTSFDNSETLLLTVMGSLKNKSLLKSALTTCLMSMGPIWRILALFSLPSCSRKLVRQLYQSSLPLLKSPSQKKKICSSSFYNFHQWTNSWGEAKKGKGGRVSSYSMHWWRNEYCHWQIDSWWST